MHLEKTNLGLSYFEKKQKDIELLNKIFNLDFTATIYDFLIDAVFALETKILEQFEKYRGSGINSNLGIINWIRILPDSKKQELYELYKGRVNQNLRSFLNMSYSTLYYKDSDKDIFKHFFNLIVYNKPKIYTGVSEVLKDMGFIESIGVINIADILSIFIADKDKPFYGMNFFITRVVLSELKNRIKLFLESNQTPTETKDLNIFAEYQIHKFCIYLNQNKGYKISPYELAVLHFPILEYKDVLSVRDKINLINMSLIKLIQNLGSENLLYISYFIGVTNPQMARFLIKLGGRLGLQVYSTVIDKKGNRIVCIDKKQLAEVDIREIEIIGKPPNIDCFRTYLDI